MKTGKKCKSCGGYMEMYYDEWCPKCDKPKMETIETLNAIRALRHVQAVSGDPKYRERMWTMFCDYINFNNDTYAYWAFGDEDRVDEYNEQYLQDVILFKRTFGFKKKDEGVLLHFSW